jgi:hypothetical protein
MAKFGQFRVNSWDPLLLIAQIIAVQSSMYFSFGIFMCFMDLFAGSIHTLDHLFLMISQVCVRDSGVYLVISYCSGFFFQPKLSDSEGRLIIFAYLLNSLVGALVLWILVKRTKLCLDFR